METAVTLMSDDIYEVESVIEFTKEKSRSRYCQANSPTGKYISSASLQADDDDGLKSGNV